MINRYSILPLLQILICIKIVSGDKCCSSSGDPINCPSSDCYYCGGYSCDFSNGYTSPRNIDYNNYVFYTPWYMRWYFWLILAIVFFVCSGSYTLCKKKNFLNRQLRQNRTDIFNNANSRNVYSSSSLSTNTNLAYRHDNNHMINYPITSPNNEYQATQYYNNRSSLSNIEHQPSISFIDTPPPSYWQIMHQSRTQTNNSINNSTTNLNNNSSPSNQVTPPPYHLNASKLDAK